MGVPINYNLRNLVQRKGTTLMTAIGIGLTVAVLVTAMALTSGLNTVFGGTGDPRHLIVLRKGTDAELTSSISNDAYQIIRRMPGIATTPQGEPMVSPEGLTVVNLPSVDSPEGMNVTVRGMLPIGLQMRPVKIEKGRMIEPGLRQIIVGQAIAKRYPDAQIGKKVRFGRGSWEVVGVFSVGETAANSEIWVDLNQLRGDFEQQGGSSSLLIRTENDAAMAELKKKIDDDQRLGSQVTGEKAYYAEMTKSGAGLQGLGFSVAIIMAIGSAFAATNTMYAAVARRSREIGTLRALGFGRWSILRSFMFESICLALIGGVLGVLIALPVNGMTTGVGSFATFSETAFKFHVGADAIIGGLIFAAIIGALGGFLPAWSASRKVVVQVMRDL
ncbi:MAG TPA: ABC transporter permease [Tepidisphaeraceae bacterium]|jgi:putative ABC transport system permease protein|nr:ABC transporter permease [Tepidisphaeraceae bacterium]